MNIREELLLRHLNIPYLWAGDNPLKGLDCSGWAIWYLSQFGAAPPGDMSAQGLYDYFLIHGTNKVQALGALSFYGKNPSQITHVAIHLNAALIVEAGSGNATTTTYQMAMEQGACIRVRPVNRRKDYVGTIMPFYPDGID